MRKKILIIFTLALVAIIALSIDFHFEKKRAFQEIILAEQNVFDQELAAAQRWVGLIIIGQRNPSGVLP